MVLASGARQDLKVLSFHQVKIFPCVSPHIFDKKKSSLLKSVTHTHSQTHLKSDPRQ